MIKAEIFNQRIKLNTESVASDSVKYLKIKFYTDESWEGALKTAVFKNETLGISKAVILDKGSSLYLGDNSCLVPYEAIKPPYFTISLSGIKGETVITTLEGKIKVYQSGDTEADPPENYTPNQYEQLLGICNETKAIAKSVREDADNGVFKGDKGDKGDTVATDLAYNPKSENAQSGKAVAEVIDNALSGMGNSLAPIIKQTVSGDVVTVNDATLFEHELNIKLKSKNLLPYPYRATFPCTNNGITFTDNGDGTITAIGTIASGAMSNFADLTTITLNAGTYTISSNTTDENVYVYFMLNSSSYWVNTPQTITLTETTNINLQIFIAGNYGTDAVTVNCVIAPQIEIGSTATDWVPHNIDLSAVSVSRYGKNLCDNIFEKGEINSSTGANQTNTSVYSVRTKNYIPILPNTEYTMTNPVKSKSRKVRYYKKDKSFLSTSSNFISSGTDSLIRTATTPNGAYYMRIQIDCDTTDLATEIRNGNHKYQFELGSSATPYEECNIKTVSSNTDGTVKGLSSISPNITLIKDNPDTVLSCEYFADTKTYIDNLIKSLL